ncbi:MAG TPA: ornithine carbamoyltransferase [Acholeplasmataceae bacterium]|nr:ornithine carbamoyltransferase [Acholeplasmataceae bacterium]
MKFKKSNLLTLLDYSPKEINYLISSARKLKKEKRKGKINKSLFGKNIVILFQKDSTRTRCAFEVAAMDLGIGVTYIGPTGSQMGKKESVKDTARVLGRMYDGIEFRGYLQNDVEILGEYSGVPIWNGLTDVYHPTQILADLLTITEKFKKLKGIKVVYLGDARNNVANSLMIGCAKMGMHFVACSPKSLWPTSELINICKEIAIQTEAVIEFSEKPLEATKDADVLYGDVWVSMGEPKEVWKERIQLLHSFQINKTLMDNAKERAIFMHCLPAFHGKNTEIGLEIATEYGNLYKEIKNGEMEVTDEVFESLKSVVFDEAENRMHTIKAVILATLGN